MYCSWCALDGMHLAWLSLGLGCSGLDILLLCSVLFAVTLTLPKYDGFKPASIHDVEVRIGNEVPSEGSPPSAINDLCVLQPHGLTKTAGSSATLICQGAPTGTVLTVQIKSKPGATDVLSLAEVVLQL